MKSSDLILRCYGEKSQGLWQLICLDLNLATQADTFNEAHEKLVAQIADYLEDALEGQDRVYAAQLLKRPAPLQYWIKYYFCRVLHQVDGAYRKALSRRAFNEVMPVSFAKA